MHRAVCLPAHFLSASQPAARLICLAHSSSHGWPCLQPGSGLSLPEGHGNGSSFTCHSRLSTIEPLPTSLNLIFLSPFPGTPRSVKPRVLYKTLLPLHSTLPCLCWCCVLCLQCPHSTFVLLLQLCLADSSVSFNWLRCHFLQEMFHFSPTTDLCFLHLCHISVVEFRILA